MAVILEFPTDVGARPQDWRWPQLSAAEKAWRDAYGIPFDQQDGVGVFEDQVEAKVKGAGAL